MHPLIVLMILDQVNAVADITPERARLSDGIIFGNERVKFINGKTYVLPR